MSKEKFCPNPQFYRKEAVSLNGQWDFGYEKRKAGFRLSEDYSAALNYYKKSDYPHKINVPFCIESELSGIGYTGFVNSAWYRKTVYIEKTDKRIFLCFGAADYQTFVLVNGVHCGSHRGGYTSFRFDITDAVKDGVNEIFVLCEDDVKGSLIMRGKQSERIKSHGCDYTRTTGIWQDVYLEFVPESYIKSFRLYPDYDNCSVTVNTLLEGSGKLVIEAFYNGKSVGRAERKNASSSCMTEIKLSEFHPWELDNGRLYDLKLTFKNDRVESYFGLRSVRLDGMKFLINGKSVFQRLVLDQGFYRKGIYTPQNDEERIRDIVLSKKLGFNGARLHQKVFDARYLYFCDKEGYIVWGEYPNWGLDYSNAKSVDIFLSEWSEAVFRDFNHPAIIGWCPFNETWDYHGRRQYNPLLKTVYEYTKAVDPTRPCIDTSGNFHVKTDIFDLHDYRFDPQEFRETYDKFVTDGELYQHVETYHPVRQIYRGEPVFISEYGGIKWETDKAHKAWGYGDDVKTEDEFAQRYCGLTQALIDNVKFCGFCYTQLYDIEQEQNGLYTYDREPKFSEETYKKIIAANTRKAAIEE